MEPPDDHPRTEQRLLAIEERLAAVERRVDGPAAPQESADELWALDELRRRMPVGGAVLFTGDVTIDGSRVAWQEASAAVDVLAEDWTSVSESLTALHHPVRLTLVQAVLRGTATVSALQELDDLGTTGQIYHHLRALVAAGWLAAGRRGHYSVPEHRVVPLLTIISAARR